MSNEFERLMTHKVTLEKLERSYTGDWSVSETFEDLEGFVEYGNKKVTDFKGETVSATALVFLKHDCPIDIAHQHWRISQTEPYVRNNMEVINIYPIDDPRNGLRHHFEVAVR